MLFHEGFMPRFIYSGMTDPLMNLSIEEYLFETMQEEELILFVFVNRDSVIIGRHQNPWLECPVDLLRDAGIPVLRRISGGGTVFHDRGNLNFSFMMRKGAFKKERNLAFVLRALETIGIFGELSLRGDILVSDRKISGNAQCFRHDRSLHHGTLLVESDLKRLNAFMRSSRRNISTHAVASVSSTVSNLEEFRSGISISEVTEALFVEFLREFGPRSFDRIEKMPDGAQPYYERNGSWEWIYGKCPAFNIDLPFSYEGREGVLSVRVEEGIITGALFTSASCDFDLSRFFSGKRFDTKMPAESLEPRGNERTGIEQPG